jgi:hypothetical protein
LKEGLQLFDWAKPANSGRDQQSDNSKNDDGSDERATRPQETGRAWRQRFFIWHVSIILRPRLSANAAGRAAHFFVFSPAPADADVRAALNRSLGADLESPSSARWRHGFDQDLYVERA